MEGMEEEKRGKAVGRMGRGLCGENRFFACPTGDCFPLAQLGPQPSRWRLCRLTDGAYPLRVKPLFLLLAKEKVVLDSEKEKVDQWK